MPGRESPSVQPRTRLERATCALEDACWWLFPAIRAERSLDGSPEQARLLDVQGFLQQSMQERAQGDVRAAWRALQAANLRLPHALTHVDRRAERRVLLAPPPSLDADPVIRWRHRTACVAWREGVELSRLRARFEGRRTPTAELLDVVAEWVCRVEFAPGWTEAGSLFASFGLDPSYDEVQRRVNQLRRFADPLAGDLGAAGWRTLRYQGLRGAVLRELAAAETPAEWRDNPLAVTVPVDHGRQAAWRYARQAQVRVAALVASAQR